MYQNFWMYQKLNKFMHKIKKKKNVKENAYYQ